MTVTYRYLTAAQWGLERTHSEARTERMPDDTAVLHHEAGNPRYHLDGAEAFRVLNEFSLSRGYWMVAYDILIHEQRIGSDKIMTIGEGRGPFMSGATKDYNEESEALCALGYFQSGHSLSSPPSAEMLEAISRGFVWGIQKGWIASNAKIIGHRDNPKHLNATTCPGDLLHPHLPAIRTRVAELLAPKVNTNMYGFVPRPANLDPRILDSRGDVGPNHDVYKMKTDQTVTVPVHSGTGKQFAIVNLTATETDGPGFFAAWGEGDRPTSSKVNWSSAQDTIANQVTVELDENGAFQLYTSTATHVVIDLVGFYQKM